MGAELGKPDRAKSGLQGSFPARPQTFDPELLNLLNLLNPWGTRGDGGEEELGWFLGTGVSNTYVVVHVQLVE